MGRNRQVMVIDGDPRSREEVETLLKGAPVAIVADAGYGVEAGSLAEELRPELIVAAVEAPVDRAIQTLRAVRDILPDCQIITYSSLTDLAVVRQVMQIGVQDFLPRPLDPADLLAAIERRSGEGPAGEGEDRAARAAGVVLTVFGAKGGIGKSTIATNLGAMIARHTNLSVLLIDMDIGFGDVAIMMDIEPRVTITDLAGSIATLDRTTFRNGLLRHPSGVHVLAAPRHPSEWSTITAEQMKGLIQFGARLFDYVILDTPGTFNDIVATAIEAATRVLVVSSLDMASIKDTAFLLDLLEAEGFPADRLNLTINNVNRVRTIKTSDIPRVVRHEIFWEIPYDEQVVRASQTGQPVVLAKPKARAAKELRGLATKVVGRETFTAYAHVNGAGHRWWLPWRHQ